jgi:hypothetical protein
MNAAPTRSRRLAVTLARHAARVLPGATWAQAMRHELDYIADDKAALRWAFGCMLASYKARYMHRPRLSPRIAWRRVAWRQIAWRQIAWRQIAWRHVTTSGALMLLIGLALQEHAASQTEPPRPVIDEMTCDLPDISPELRPRQRCGPCRASVAADFIDPAQDTSCTDQSAPTPVLPKRR